jgi:hypothetical protein
MSTSESAAIRDLIQALLAFHISSPADPFLQGWRKLPDELKLEIIRHALPSGITFSGRFFKKESIPSLIDLKNEPHRYSSDDPLARALQYANIFEKALFLLLACSETVSFVNEAFYTQNTFELFDDRLLPLPAARSFIRHATLSGNVSRWWDLIVKFADGSLDLSNLHVVEIDIGFSGINWLQKMGDPKGIRFQTRKLRLSYRHGVTNSLFCGPGRTSLKTMDRVEIGLLSELSIVADRGLKGDRWERISRGYPVTKDNVDNVRFCQAWSEDEDDGTPRSRTTTRLLWV